jgi:uncharacterized protein VirK/YbjX
MPLSDPTLPSLKLLLAPVEAMLHWPGLAQMRGATHTRSNNLGRQIKLAWALLCTRPHRAQFGRVLALHRHWQPVFEHEVRSFEPLVQSFMDRRFGMAQRFAQLQHDLSTATQALGLLTSARIALGEQVVLWDLPGGATVRLGLNTVCRREGLWALSLCSTDGLRVCQISLSFLTQDRLMLGSVQGAAAQDALAMQAVRELTHAAEGLRPAFLLVEVLRALCQRWDLALVGVDPQHHVKRRWHQRRLKVAFDYCGFWTELGGHKAASGMWTLPLRRPPRELGDVPAKRRAMYRRRQALLAALPAQLRHLPDGQGRPALADEVVAA